MITGPMPWSVIVEDNDIELAFYTEKTATEVFHREVENTEGKSVVELTFRGRTEMIWVPSTEISAI